MFGQAVSYAVDTNTACFNEKDVFVWLLKEYGNATRNIGPKRRKRLACFPSMVSNINWWRVLHLQAKGRSGSDTSSHLAARGGRIFSAYFSVNCLLHIYTNYTENVMDLYTHAQTMDTRRSSPIFEAPGYEAMPGCCPLRRTQFSNFVCMRKCSLVPRPKTMVNGLRARQVHKQNCELTSRQYARLTHNVLRYISSF